MDLSSLPAPLRTLLDAPQDWMDDGEKVSGELILRSDGTCIGAGGKKGKWSFPNAVTEEGALIVEATIGGVDHTIRYDVPDQKKGGRLTGVVLEPEREPRPRCRARKDYVALSSGSFKLGADADSEGVIVGIYQEPNKDLATKRMRARQAYDHVTGEMPPLDIGFERTSRVFGSGICFYWILVRDYAVAMVSFTLLSFWYYHMIRTRTEQNNTSVERLPGLSRASLGALLMWGNQQAQEGYVFTDEDRDGMLAISILDTLMMFALAGVALYHFFRKKRARDEADMNSITMDDYSIVVEDLPTDVTADRIRKHFEKFGVVNEVVMGYDLREMMALRRKLLDQEGNQEMLEWMLKRANSMLGIDDDFNKDKWVKVFEHVAGEGVVLDLGANAINEMFARTKIWRFDYADQPRAYYARHGDITNDFDAYANMLRTWSARDNVPAEDFEIYGSEDDLKSARNPWTEHAADAAGVGFPRDSGPAGAQPGMYACLPDSAGYRTHGRGDTTYAFYLPSSPVLFGEPVAYKPPPPKYSLTAFSNAITPTKSVFYTSGTFSVRSPEVMKALFKTKAQKREEAVSRIQRNYRAYRQRQLEADKLEADKLLQAKKLSMSQRAASMAKRAKNAAKNTAVSAVKNTAGKAGKVAGKAGNAKIGVLKKFRPDDFNPDKLRERIAKTAESVKETKATIEARAKEGYTVVKAWVVFEDEQSRFDCMDLVVKSEEEVRMNKNGTAAAAADDVCVFEGHRINPNAARAPSDTMWENLGYSKKQAGLRTCRSLFVLFAYLVFNVLTVAVVQSQIKNLPPEAICEEIENGLVDNLHCSKIWDVESTNATVAALAKRGLKAMQKPLITLNQCDVYMDYKLFSGDATPYYDYYNGSHPLAPTPTALENAIVAQEAKTVADPNPVGMDPNSLIDECAAAVCMACYCSDYVAESDDDTYCMKYSMDNLMRALFGGVATVIAAVLNVLVKTLSIWLSEKEHHHSYTDFEKSVTWKIMSVMMLIMVLLPLFMTANIPAASLGFLFNGEHKDFSPWWYSEFATKFQQVAFINAFSLPFSMASKVIVFELKRRFLAGGVKTQTQLDELYTPPPYLISERYGMFTSAVLYTLMFSSGMPLLYLIMMVMCGVLTLVDRVVLLRFNARPPRYTGKLSVMLVHSVPVGILIHLLIAVYMYGERDLPSYTHMGGMTGKWGDGTGVAQDDHQFDVSARIARLNGFIPFVGFIVLGTSFLVAYAALVYAKMKQKGEGDANIDEDLPPITQVKKAKQISGLSTYSITAHPEYQALFPPGNLVSKSL